MKSITLAFFVVFICCNTHHVAAMHYHQVDTMDVESNEQSARPEQVDHQETQLATWEIIQRRGREVSMGATERLRLQDEIRELMQDLLGFMTLMELEELDAYANQRRGPKYQRMRNTLPDAQTVQHFLSLFPQELLNEPLIKNFFQPSASPEEITAYLSPLEYVEKIPQWFYDIDILAEVTLDDRVYRHRPRLFSSATNYTHALLRLAPFLARCDVSEDCPDGRVEESIVLSVIIEVLDQTGVTATGEVIRHRIRFIDEHDPRPPTPERQNWWAFAGIQQSNSIMGFQANPVDGPMQDLTLNSDFGTGVMANFSIFFGDTATFAGRQRLWDFGFEIGVGASRQHFQLELNQYSEMIGGLQETPLHHVPIHAGSLEVIGSEIRQSATLDVISFPASFLYKRYFSSKRVQSVVVQAGATYHMLVNERIKQDSGFLSGYGRDVKFVDDADFDPIHIHDLPYYGFGSGFPIALSDDLTNPFASDFITTHLRLGIHLRQSRFSALHYTITPWIMYGFTNLIADSNYNMALGYNENIVYNSGSPTVKIDHLGSSLESMHPIAFGIDLGISYNIVRNRVKKER